MPNPDAKAIRRTLDGQPESFAHIVERYHSAVKALALARLNNPADAEDICQETFLRAFKNLRQYDSGRPFGPWLLTIARNLIHDRQASQARERLALQSPGDRTQKTEPQIDDTKDVLRQTLYELEENDREILLLYYFTGKDTREIASLLHISAQAAEKRLQRARTRLNERITHKLGDALEDYRPTKKQTRRIIGIVLGTSALSASGHATHATVLKPMVVGALIIAAIFATIYFARYGTAASSDSGRARVAMHSDSDEVAIQITSTPAINAIDSPALSMHRQLIEIDTTPSEEPTPQSAEESLHGRVYDARTNAPITDFRLHLIDWEVIRDFRSDDGRFALTELDPDYFVTFFAKANDYYRSDTVTGFVRDLLQAPIQIPLQPSDYVHGVVRDDAGRPIEGASVTVFSQNGSSSVTAQSISLANGHFHAEFPRDLPTTIRAEKHGYVNAIIPFPESPRRTELVLMRMGAIEGSVYGVAGATYVEMKFFATANGMLDRVFDDDTSADSIQAIQIAAYRHDADGISFRSPEVWARKDGAFLFGELPHGRYTVVAKHRFADRELRDFSMSVEIDVLPHQTTWVNLQPPIGNAACEVQIHGNTNEATPEVLQGVDTIWQFSESAVWVIHHETRTGLTIFPSNSGVPNEGLPPGKATIVQKSVAGASAYLKGVEVNLKDGQTAIAEFDIADGAAILFDTSTASVDQYLVSVLPLSNPNWPAVHGSHTELPIGAASPIDSIRGLNPGAYQINVQWRPEGGRPTAVQSYERIHSIQTIQVQDNEEITIPLP